MNDPPPYEDDARDDSRKEGQLGSAKQPQRASLSARLAEEQNKRVTALVQDYVDTLLDELPTTGLSKTVLILVPSDVKNLQNDDEPSKADIVDSRGAGTNEEIIGFSDDEYIRLVRLHGQDNSSRFWQQASVIRDLDHLIRRRLGLETSRESDPTSPAGPAPAKELPVRPEKRRNFGLFSSKSVGNVPMFNARPDFEPSGQQQAGAADIWLKIAREEVSVRSSTPVGLYDTQSAHVLVIRIHIRP